MKKISDTLIYSPPNFDYSKINSYKKQIIYIPKSNQNNEENYIPCLFVIEYNYSANFLIYFHGNGEDIFSCELLGFHISRELKMNIIIVEYPGYSIYPGQPDSEIILNDSLIVYDFIKNTFKLDECNIFVCGRSLGSSPSIYLASKKRINTLFLISAFESIKKVGKGFFAGVLFEDIFKSIEFIPFITCNVLFIHGKNDALISYKHSQNLFNNCPAKNKDIVINEKMTHNEIDFMKDIINPIVKFLKNKNIFISQENNHFNINCTEFDNLFIIPNKISKALENKFFVISNFSDVKKIPTTENTCILPISNEILIFSNNNIINFYFYDEQKSGIKEDDKVIITNLCKISDNTFIYLTNNGKFVIYKFDQINLKHLITITLKQPKKVILSEDENMFVLDDDGLVKIEIGENKSVNKEIIRNDIYKRNISKFSDILEIKKNIIILSSNLFYWFVALDVKKNKILYIKERINPINKEHLYKLNENSFIIIEKSGIVIFDSSNFLIITEIRNNIFFKGMYGDFYEIRSLFVIDEDSILIGDSKGIITQFNIKTNTKINSINISNDLIESFYMLKKKTLIIFTRNKDFIERTSYNIEIRRKGKNDKNDNCNIY